MSAPPPDLATAVEGRGIGWAWHPPLPPAGVPVFVWPPRPLAALRFPIAGCAAARTLQHGERGAPRHGERGPGQGRLHCHHDACRDRDQGQGQHAGVQRRGLLTMTIIRN